MSGPQIFTIGHSTRPLADFVALLHGHDVSLLADVRTVPRSRHNPQYDTDALAAALPAEGIRYTHLAGLGGFRRPRADSPNTGWRNLSFRGYADYMQTAEFAAELAGLIDMSRARKIAIMCAEAVPWRCHRSLIADALVARGIGVEEIVSATRSQLRKITPFAEVHGTTVTYPPPQGTLELPHE